MLINEVSYKWEKLHCDIFSSFILSLNNEKIKYFILRNYEGLPQYNNSKDIDIIIEPGFYKLAKKLLIEIFKRFKIQNYYLMNFEPAHCLFGIDFDKDFAIHIDLIEGYSSKGYEILSFDILYANCKVYKNFKVLGDSYNVVMLILYKIIGCKEIKDKYRQEIKELYPNNANDINAVLLKILGDDLGEKILGCIMANDFSQIVNNASIIGKEAKKRALKRNILGTIIGWCKFYSEKTHRILLCPRDIQKFICVEAPDGTGKTTFIDSLTIKIAEYFVSERSKSHIYHFRPTLLPNLGEAGEKMRVMKQDKDFTRPHRAKPASLISSLIRMTYYWLDYLIGVPLILRKDAQFDNFTIFDRYIYDFLVDPRRTRINLPYLIRRVFTMLVKQPRIIFVLSTDAETIYKRKQELTKEEIERQLKEFAKLTKLGKRVHILDASKAPDEIANDAVKIIIKEFTKEI